MVCNYADKESSGRRRRCEKRVKQESFLRCIVQLDHATNQSCSALLFRLDLSSASCHWSKNSGSADTRNARNSVEYPPLGELITQKHAAPTGNVETFPYWLVMWKDCSVENLSLAGLRQKMLLPSKLQTFNPTTKPINPFIIGKQFRAI